MTKTSNTYHYISVTAKPFPLSQIMNDLNPDVGTPVQEMINAEIRLALLAPELLRQLKAVTFLVETLINESGRTEYLPLIDAAHTIITKVKGAKYD